jgi:nitroimidazol reductase NimA-like FMN-containing flavoprotein (pyridoxamine 5'-phosphate oxidase superfamily)
MTESVSWTASQRQAGNAGRALEEIDQAECLRLISPGGVGRIAFTGRFGPTVLPVGYKLHDGAIVFLMARDGPTNEDLRTGIAHAEYHVAFEIDEFNVVDRAGWSVMVQGSVHHVDSADERASLLAEWVEAWPEGAREHFIRITPTHISGRRISHMEPAGVFAVPEPRPAHLGVPVMGPTSPDPR